VKETSVIRHPWYDIRERDSQRCRSKHHK